MCKTVYVIEPSKVHPYIAREKQQPKHPRPPTPPLKSSCDDLSTTIQSVHTERTQELVGYSTILERPVHPTSSEEHSTPSEEDSTPSEEHPTSSEENSTPSEEHSTSNTLIDTQEVPFIKTSVHRRLWFGAYVGSVVGVSFALLYHLRYELANPDLLPVHILMLLIGVKLLYGVRHFQ